MTSTTDILQRFEFEGAPVRGEWVCLESSWQDVLARHPYPAPLRKILGEWMAAASLLTATLKLVGSMIVQLQGKGPVSLLVVECTQDQRLRAMARWEGDLDGLSLREMVGEGICAITLDQGDGKPSYQGLVPIESDSVASIIEDYMRRSEQIDTRLWLASDDTRTAGLLLQKLPEGHGDPDTWTRVQHLASTVKEEELLTLDGQTVLYRLFNEETVRLLRDDHPYFACSCSRNKVAAMLKMIGRAEVESILAEQGHVASVCEFCNSSYEFDSVDIAALFIGAIDVPPTAH